MYGSNVQSQCLVQAVIHLVQKQEDEIKTREKSSWEVDVFVRLQLLVIATINRVSCGQDGGPRIQAGGDSSLSD